MKAWPGVIEQYREFLPVSDRTPIVTLREGNTPLVPAPRLAEATDPSLSIYLKCEGFNPTGSFKDRGMTMAMSKALEAGSRAVICASTGNTSASAAAYAARAGLKAFVMVPKGAIALGKLSQAAIHGAKVLMVDGNFDQALSIVRQISETHPVTLVNSVNPFRLEGQKTPAFEMVEQLDWQVPEHVVVPGGNLANGSALGKGFSEMKHLGLIDRVPKISVIQAKGANPLFQWFTNDHKELDPVTADTRATAIRIGNPASWRKAAHVIQATGGWCEDVTESEIAFAKAQIGAEVIGCEPASAVTLAGLKKLVVQGNFGMSMEWRRPVTEVIGDRLWLTVVVSVAALFLTWVLALPIGIYSAVRQYSVSDYVATFIGFIGLAVPNFLLALVILYFGFILFNANIGGLFTPELQDAPWSMAKVWDLLKHLPVPALILGLAGTAQQIRIMRANLLDELRKPYVVTARSKGLPESTVILKYPVRVALNPFASTIGYTLPYIVSGSIIVSIVLGLPTVGPLLLKALIAQDMFLAGTIVLLLGVMTVIGTLISDILLVWIDPRIRIEDT